MTKILQWVIFGCCAVYYGLAQQNWAPFQRGNRANDEWSPWKPPWYNYDNSVVVRTVYGDVKGFSIPWQTDDLDWDPDWEEHPPWYTRRVNCFLGVPYATAPLGKLRFDRPRKPRWGGLHWDATYFRPSCPQTLDQIRRDIPDYPKANVSEDCLYMNIFAPNMTYYLGPNQQYPVFIWINSGDFSQGTAQVHPGQVLATKGIVVVTFNYRLGVFGFMSTQDRHAPGNFGLFDQLLLLEFVRENIKAFQGDPDRITIGGDGAGGASVGFHLISEITRNKGFFHQCIMMSGSDMAKWAFLEPHWQPRDYALDLGQRLGCPTHDIYMMVDCLRDNITHSTEKIFDASLQVESKDGELGVVWGPTQDGGWFQEHPIMPQQPYLRYTPRDMRNQGWFDQNVPCLVGLNTQDGAKKANETEPGLEKGITTEQFRDYVMNMLRDWGISEMYHERACDAIEFQYTYWPDSENRTARTMEFIHMITDITVGAPLNDVLHRQANSSPHWMYLFNFKSWNDWLPMWMGVSHSAAVPYVFGVPFMNETVLNETELDFRQRYDYEERNMSTWMMYLFTNFMKEGHPNPNVTLNVTWEPYNFYNRSYLVVDWHNYMWFNYRHDKYSFWNEYFPKIAKPEYYYATPTPAGYEYVIATGWMSACVVVLICFIGFLAFMLVYQAEHNRLKAEYPRDQIPLNLQRSHPPRSTVPGMHHNPWQQSPRSTMTSTSVSLSWQGDSGKTGRSTFDNVDIPRGWQTGGASRQYNPPTGHRGSGFYSNTDFSDDDEKEAMSDLSSGPDPYRTLETKQPDMSKAAKQGPALEYEQSHKYPGTQSTQQRGAPVSSFQNYPGSQPIERRRGAPQKLHPYASGQVYPGNQPSQPKVQYQSHSVV